MATIYDALIWWPRDNKGRVYMKSSEEAIFYASLMYDNPSKVEEIKRLRRESISQVGAKRNKPDIDMDLLLQIATQGQFYRECLEEVDRLKNQTYQLNQGGK